jgi:hypothetical protein
MTDHIGAEEHTPGPWQLVKYDAIWTEKGRFLCDLTFQDMPFHERHGNARLIAAAPNLLAALEELLGEWDERDKRAAQEPGCGGLNETFGVTLARAAIAKSKGE